MQYRLTDFLHQNNVLYNKQFAFRKNHSITFAIVELVDKITVAMDHRQMTLETCLDLYKAFDTIQHEILWAKLDHYGIREKIAIEVFLPQNTLNTSTRVNLYYGL